MTTPEEKAEILAALFNQDVVTRLRPVMRPDATGGMKFDVILRA